LFIDLVDLNEKIMDPVKKEELGKLLEPPKPMPAPTTELQQINDSEAIKPPLIKLTIPNSMEPPLNAANSFRTETVRKNWKTVLDVAMTNRNFPNNNLDNLNRNRDGSVNYHSNDIFVSDKFNWIFFAIIISLLVILSVFFCSLVYFFLPKFRIA